MADGIRSCVYCGATMENPRRIQCGEAGCKRRHDADRQRSLQRAYREKHGVSLSRTYEKSFACLVCGLEFTGGVTRKYCSVACGNVDRKTDKSKPVYRRGERKSQFTARQDWARRTLRMAARGKAGTIPWFQGNCRECGRSFVGRQARFCSVRCARRSKAYRNRIRRRTGVRIDAVRRWHICCRDNWTCHICELPVDPTVEFPALDSPVLDHVVALAAGGSSEESNIKLAHHWCNSVKRDLPLDQVA